MSKKLIVTFAIVLVAFLASLCCGQDAIAEKGKDVVKRDLQAVRGPMGERPFRPNMAEGRRGGPRGFQGRPDIAPTDKPKFTPKKEEAPRGEMIRGRGPQGRGPAQFQGRGRGGRGPAQFRGRGFRGGRVEAPKFQGRGPRGPQGGCDAQCLRDGKGTHGRGHGQEMKRGPHGGQRGQGMGRGHRGGHGR